MRLEDNDVKKILFVVPSLEEGGVTNLLITLTDILVERGFDITVLLVYEKPSYPALNESVHVCFKPEKEFHILNKIPYIRRKYYDGEIYKTKASARTLYNYYVGKEKFDVEIAFFRGLAVKIISGSSNRHSKKIAWVHSDFKYCKGVQAYFNDLDEVKNAYSKFDRIVCVSNGAKASFEEVIGCPGKTILINNMVSTRRIQNQSLESAPVIKSRFTIISVGRFVAAKGYDRLLSVFKRLKEEGMDIELWLIGDGGLYQDFSEYITQNDLNHVKLLGYQKNPFPYLRYADAFVCSSRFEGFSLSVLEALAYGLPVISTDCGGPNDMLEDGKFGLVVNNSEDGLYEGIKRMYLDEGLRNHYREMAAVRARDFDAEIMIEQVLSLF